MYIYIHIYIYIYIYILSFFSFFHGSLLSNIVEITDFLITRNMADVDM